MAEPNTNLEYIIDGHNRFIRIDHYENNSSRRVSDVFSNLVNKVVRYFQEKQLAVFYINQFNQEEFVKDGMFHQIEVKPKKDYTFVLRRVVDYDKTKNEPVYQDVDQFSVSLFAISNQRTDTVRDATRDYAAYVGNSRKEIYNVKLSSGKDIGPLRANRRIQPDLVEYLNSELN